MSDSISHDDVDDTIGSKEAIVSSHPKHGLTIDEQLLKADELKAEGNTAYESGELTEALRKWHYVSGRHQHTNDETMADKRGLSMVELRNAVASLLCWSQLFRHALWGQIYR